MFLLVHLHSETDFFLGGQNITEIEAEREITGKMFVVIDRCRQRSPPAGFGVTFHFPLRTFELRLAERELLL